MSDLTTKQRDEYRKAIADALDSAAEKAADLYFNEYGVKTMTRRDRKIDGLGIAVASWHSMMQEKHGGDVLPLEALFAAALEDINYHTEAAVLREWMQGNRPTRPLDLSDVDDKALFDYSLSNDVYRDDEQLTETVELDGTTFKVNLHGDGGYIEIVGVAGVHHIDYTGHAYVYDANATDTPTLRMTLRRVNSDRDVTDSARSKLYRAMRSAYLEARDRRGVDAIQRENDQRDLNYVRQNLENMKKQIVHYEEWLNRKQEKIDGDGLDSFERRRLDKAASDWKI